MAGHNKPQKKRFQYPLQQNTIHSTLSFQPYYNRLSSINRIYVVNLEDDPTSFLHTATLFHAATLTRQITTKTLVSFSSPSDTSNDDLGCHQSWCDESN